MTVIAAIYPSKGLPLFLCDTVISVPGQQTGRIAGPGGLIARPASTTQHKFHSLEQKNTVLKDTVFVAYAGSSFVGKTVFRRLEKGLSGVSTPTEAQVSAILSDSNDDLQKHGTAILAAVLHDGRCHHLAFGTRFEELTLQDGTTIYVNGSGTQTLLDYFSTHWTATFKPRDLPSWFRHPIVRLRLSLDKWRWGTHHEDVFRAFGMVAEISSRESIMAEIDSHFGAIVEVIRATSAGFEKLPSGTIVTELITFEDGGASIIGGNYLNYAYDGDLLVYRRFGQIRDEEMRSAFGTDYISGAISPPLRNVSTQEEHAAQDRLTSKAIFNDSIIQCRSYSDPHNLPQRRISLGAPNHGEFLIRRNGDHFEIYRSHEFMRKLAARLGVAKVIVQTRETHGNTFVAGPAGNT
jgi:hypothetical protein